VACTLDFDSSSPGSSPGGVVMKRYKCDICSKEFDKSQSYAAHMSHHSDNSINKKNILERVLVVKACKSL
jgi:hypothetical protein